MYQVIVTVDADEMGEAIDWLEHEVQFMRKVGEIVAHCGQVSVRVSIIPDKRVVDQHYDSSHYDDCGSFPGHEDTVHLDAHYDAHEDTFVPRDDLSSFWARLLIAVLTDARSLWLWFKEKW